MEQSNLFNSEHGTQNTEPQPVTCLGIEFPSDEARWEHFTNLLRDRLRDPEFRKIEGFPIGSDEDILNLSDPPYYTACPNPWIADFIAEWEAEKSAIQVQSSEFRVQSSDNSEPKTQNTEPAYHREPFAADVSEGKNDPIYNAHSYHTKVPHKAIMRYILHYTQPGDIVFDGFCGTGMTGVAAQMCGNRNQIDSIGYKVSQNGIITEDKQEFSRLGQRHPILCDLSSIATFIAGTLNTPEGQGNFKKSTSSIISTAEKELKWLYETNHTEKIKGVINYIVWSEVFICSNCSGEFSFYDGSFDERKNTLSGDLTCPSCGSVNKKRSLERAFETAYDTLLKKPIKRVKQKAVSINYSVGAKRHTKKPDEDDLLLLERVERFDLTDWFPANEIPQIERFFKDGLHLIKINNTTQFYTKRNLIAAARLYRKMTSNRQKLMFTSFCDRHIVKRNRWLPTGPTRPLNNTLYFPPLFAEVNVFNIAKRKLKDHIKAYQSLGSIQGACISCQSSTKLSSIPSSSIDYIFTDPPFGWNLIYSELSFLWESWLNINTSNNTEAIVNEKAEKSLHDYRYLITECFKENYRVLKPGRWMTVEFHNSSNSVWVSIQEALTAAGFIIADVKTIDKKQGSINQDYYRGGAVKQDLAITAYKPSTDLEKSFQLSAGTEDGVWMFIRNHLKQLPIFNTVADNIKQIAERRDYLLFDRMVAFHVQHSVTIPISAADFYLGLASRFSERDGMYFLPEQVNEYDRKKSISGKLAQMTLFVSDEASAIQWLRQLIKEKPQTFSDINPQFMQQLGGWSKNEAQLDLRELLNQNFLNFDGKGKIPSQIVSWMRRSSELRPIIEAEFKSQGIELSENLELETSNQELRTRAQARWYVPDPNKAGDLEKLREKALLKEFEEYKEAKKKLKVFRLEAVRAGFKKAWQERDYAVIVAVADKIPNNVLEEDPKLLMWYDQAVTRMGG